MKNLSKISFLGILLMLLYFGCKKDQSKSAAGSLPVKTVAAVSVPDGMILTPQGLMPKANVHLVENGYHLELRGGHVLKIKTATGEMKEDFGAIKVAAATVNTTKSPAGSVAQNGMGRTDVTSQPDGNNWKTYAEYSAGSSPIGLCQSTWTVPVAPGTSGAQIYIGNGVENNPHSNSSANLVIEPALLYGSNGDPNTSATGWTISNWCSWNNGGAAAYTTPIAVTAGTNLTGIVTLTNYVSPNYQYTCAFNGYSNPLTVLYNSTLDVTGTAMPAIPIESYAFESLQAYSLTSFGQYPNQPSVNMTNILVETGTAGSGGNFTTPQSLQWSYYSTAQAVYGEHTVITTNPTTNPNTTVPIQLWFHYGSPCITIPAGAGPGGVYQTCAGTPITTGAPVSTCGGGITYTFSPATPPAGVTYNSNGTVTAGASTAAGTYNFTITATNNGGSSSGNATIKVLTSTVLTYQTAYVFDQGVSVGSVTPTTTGSAATSCTSSPALPPGLSVSANGTITGTPKNPQAPAVYTFTYSNGSCSSTSSMNIAIAMPFYMYNNILEYGFNGVLYPNTGYGNTFAYFYTGASLYSTVLAYSPANVFGVSNPSIAWLPPGNYNVFLNPENGPAPDPHDSFSFNNGGPSGPGPGNTFNNVNISPSGSTTLTINN